MFELDRLTGFAAKRVIKVVGLRWRVVMPCSTWWSITSKALKFICANTEPPPRRPTEEHQGARTVLATGVRNVTQGSGCRGQPADRREAGAMEEIAMQHCCSAAVAPTWCFITGPAWVVVTGYGCWLYRSLKSRAPMGILTVAVVTKPFRLKGRKRNCRIA